MLELIGIPRVVEMGKGKEGRDHHGHGSEKWLDNRNDKNSSGQRVQPPFFYVVFACWLLRWLLRTLLYKAG